jgi:hypothetical protein
MRCNMCGCEVGADYKERGAFRICRHCSGAEPKKDNINPSHYKQGKFETIDVIEDITKDGFDSYLVGNIIKYLSRYKYKNGLEDLKKAQWYLERLVKQKEPN